MDRKSNSLKVQINDQIEFRKLPNKVTLHHHIQYGICVLAKMNNRLMEMMVIVTLDLGGFHRSRVF